MTPVLKIKAGERSVIRLFAINRPPEELAVALKTQPKADLARKLLGAPHLDTNSAEVFPISDLSGVGLVAYLTEGYAVEEAGILPDRARLEALDGYVLLLFSDSFHDAETTLAPGSDLTLIGTYAEHRPVASAPPLTAESARPYSGTPGMTPPVPPKGPAGSALVVIALTVGAGLLAWWLLK